MSRTTKLQRELLRASNLRARASNLQSLPENDWNDWEFDWLNDQVNRSADYIYSDKQWAVLEKLELYAQEYTEYSGFSVKALIDIGYASRYDVDESDQEFIEQLYRKAPKKLRRRQITRLASVCRMFENIEYDDLIVTNLDDELKQVA